MQKEDKVFEIRPAERVNSIQEYYFSRKLKEVAEMNAAGMNVISLGIGSPDMPPSDATIDVLCEHADRRGTSLCGDQSDAEKDTEQAGAFSAGD